MEADAAALGCEAELEWLRTIAAQGTSADRQLAVFAAAPGDVRQALSATVDWIAAATAGTASCCGSRRDGAEEQSSRLTSFGASNTSGWTLMTIRGGGDPSQNTVIEPFVRMGPLPRSLAAEAHGCFMVRTPLGPTEYKVAARDSRALAGPPRVVPPNLLGHTLEVQ